MDLRSEEERPRSTRIEFDNLGFSCPGGGAEGYRGAGGSGQGWTRTLGCYAAAFG